MSKLFKLRKDTHAVGTIAIVVAVVVILVAAAAAYVLLSGDSEEKNTETEAPGSVLNYEVNGSVKPSFELQGTIDIRLVGQNSTQQLTETVYDLYLVSGSDRTPLQMDAEYELSDKDTGAYEGMEKNGTANISTIDGTKTLNVWEQTEDSVTMKAYIDGSGIIYRISLESEGISFDADLKSKDIVLQDSYEESPIIGNNLTYSVSGTEGGIPVTGTLTIDVVAESSEDIWQRTTTTIGSYTQVEYSIVDTSTDEPVGSEPAGQQTISTIDGEKRTDIWKIDNAGLEYKYYIDSESGITYRITATSPDVTLTMELTSKILAPA
jgi:hypothetical protein